MDERHSIIKDQILDDENEVLGEIYVITNTSNNKRYVGQVVSHRLNHGRYRPFGHTKRLNDHVSEALCNNKTKQCSYLNNAIRKHGKSAFTVDLLEVCDRKEMNMREQYYIAQLDTLHPHGYNLTTGGRQSSTTTVEARRKTMESTQKQFYDSKVQKFSGVNIDTDNLDQYLRLYHSRGLPYYVVKIDGKKAIFQGQHQDIDDVRKSAIAFLKQIASMSQHNQIAGTP